MCRVYEDNSKCTVLNLFNFHVLQKKQMMHPAMYDCPRYSQRIASSKMPQAALSFKKSQAQSLAGLWLTKYIHQKIPVGIDCQAEVPEWMETVSDRESKWLGTRIWPQDKRVIERDPTGFGRPDQCSCEFQGSFECVRLHVSEKRIRLKLELGVAFYDWNIDKMGEEVALSWNKSEELNFEAVIRSNPPSKVEDFWEGIREHFDYKRWKQLLSYYFNVFLLRRRGLQNRCSPTEISSDDEDLEFETTTNCSGQTAARVS
ncbi:AT-rich interactive domain-containing protein 2-like [Apium graveolens]|uniref:AT-rich interactive domain-containing protein 2-like n=1 Tax=Apium graveolens TaxID=4045 RepID=UPI003D7AB6E8